MNKNKLYICAVVLVCICGIILYQHWHKNALQPLAKKPIASSSPTKDKEFSSNQTNAGPIAATTVQWMAKAASGEGQAPLAFAESPFRLVGRGRSARIVHSKSDKVISPPPERGIYGFSPSPSGDYLLIYYGDADYEIRFSDSEQIIHLPSVPNSPNPVGFGWHWLSNDILIGIGGIGYGADSKPESKCCDQHTVSESLIGVYRLSDMSFSLVDLPIAIKGKVFDLGTRSSSGTVELLSSGHVDDGKSLGWFSISPE
jgi:hypothetical protein